MLSACSAPGKFTDAGIWRLKFSEGKELKGRRGTGIKKRHLPGNELNGQIRSWNKKAAFAGKDSERADAELEQEEQWQKEEVFRAERCPETWLI